MCRKTHFTIFNTRRHTVSLVKHIQSTNYCAFAGDCIWNPACSLPEPPNRTGVRVWLTGEGVFAQSPAANTWSPGEFSLYFFFFLDTWKYNKHYCLQRWLLMSGHVLFCRNRGRSVWFLDFVLLTRRKNVFPTTWLLKTYLALQSTQPSAVMLVWESRSVIQNESWSDFFLNYIIINGPLISWSSL